MTRFGCARTFRFPAAAHDMIGAGLQRVVDFQDVAYGKEYLDLLSGMLALDKAAGGGSKRLRAHAHGGKIYRRRHGL